MSIREWLWRLTCCCPSCGRYLCRCERTTNHNEGKAWGGPARCTCDVNPAPCPWHGTNHNEGAT